MNCCSLCGYLHLFLQISFLLEVGGMTSGSDALIRISQEEMWRENWAIRGSKNYMHITLTTICSWAGNPKLHRHPLQNPSLNKPNCHRSFIVSMARHMKWDLLLAIRVYLMKISIMFHHNLLFKQTRQHYRVIKWHLIKIDTWRLFVGSVLGTCEVYLLWTSKQGLEIINNILVLTGIIWITEANTHTHTHS